MEYFRPSKEVKEATPAGDRYFEAKTGVQFFGELDKLLLNRIAEAKAKIEAYAKVGHKVRLTEEDGKKVIIRDVSPTMREMIREAEDWLIYLRAIETKKRAEAALRYVPELKTYLENDIFKGGIQAISKKISEDDELLAAVLSETPP